MAKAFVPLALLFILAACGSSKQKTPQAAIEVRGKGYSFEAVAGAAVGRPAGRVVARRAGSVVSVSVFPLRKAYDERQFDAVSKTLDAVAARLAKAAGASVDERETLTLAGRKIRAYRYGGKRIGFVLVGRREYQLFCVHDDAACDLLFRTFTLAGPQA